MSNNIFNIQAAEAGRAFARANPEATGVEIDEAAPPFNPARRHFQDAALDLLNRQRTQIFYRWSVRCRSGHCSGGMANTTKEALEFIKDCIELYRDQYREVVSYSVYNQDEQRVVAMDLT